MQKVDVDMQMQICRNNDAEMQMWKVDVEVQMQKRSMQKVDVEMQMQKCRNTDVEIKCRNSHCLPIYKRIHTCL